LLEERGGTPVLGVLPWIKDLKLPEEDAVALLNRANTPAEPSADAPNKLDIAVIHFPHIANFDDFDPLESDSRVNLRYVGSPDQLGTPDVIILPGTKNTLSDLQWLRETGLAGVIVAHANRQIRIVGICGGYQMLGQRIRNPHGFETARILSADGLQLLDVETTFQHKKQTFQVTATVLNGSVAPNATTLLLRGYEIHVGQTVTRSPWLSLARSGANEECQVLDGACSDGGKVWGCYLHGIFHNDAFRNDWLRSLGAPISVESKATDVIEASLERLADAFESHIDMKRLNEMIWPNDLALGAIACHQPMK